MTWHNRLRLWGGLLVVVAVAAALTLVVNQRSRQAYSSDAQVGADTASVSSAYGGVVVAQEVEHGDPVRKGDVLLTLSSPDLRRDVANGLNPVSTKFHEVDPDEGHITILAPMSGTVTDLRTEVGSFVPAGDFATLPAGGSQYVTAEFRLTPDQYGRLEVGGPARVELPSRQRMSGSIADVAVRTSEGVAVTTVEVDVPDLRSPDLTSLNQPGSPVAVTLTLADAGVLAGPTDRFMEFLHRAGVR